MFKEMRQKRKLMSESDTIQIIKATDYGTLATLGTNGYPYSVPLNYAYHNNAIYFHSAQDGNKIENITFNNHVSFSIVSYYKILPEKFDAEYDSVIVYGKVFEVTDSDEKKQALLLLLEKYSANFQLEGMAYIERAINAVSIYKIQVEHMTGKLGR